MINNSLKVSRVINPKGTVADTQIMENMVELGLGLDLIEPRSSFTLLIFLVSHNTRP